MCQVKLSIATIALAIAAASCTAGKTSSANKADPAPSLSSANFAALDRRFEMETSQFEKLRLATQLGRLAPDRGKYVDYINQQAKDSLTRRDQIVRSILQREMESTAAAMRKRGDLYQALTSSRASVVANRDSHGVADATNTTELHEWKELPANIETPADPNALAAVMALSMVGHSDGRTLLQALRSGEEGIACEAALGLARLKRKETIGEISRVARASRDFVCAQALVYFGDPSADQIAADLLRDKKLFLELRETAKSRNYDPYFQQP